MSFDFLNRKKKAREAEENARREEDAWARYAQYVKREQEEKEQARIKAEYEKEQARLAEEEYQRTIQQNEIMAKQTILKEKIDNAYGSLMYDFESVYADIDSFLNYGTLSGSTIAKTYESMCAFLDVRVAQMELTLSKMKEANDLMVTEYHGEDRYIQISQAEKDVLEPVKKEIGRFKQFFQRVYAFPPSKMMDEKNYGKNNPIYWEVVRGMGQDEAKRYIYSCEQQLDDSQRMYEIDLEKVMRCVWLFATEKPFSSLDFQKAKRVFQQHYRQSHVDVIIADLYVRKSMGGEDALRQPVKDILKQQVDTRTLTIIASSLMWMNAYQVEHMVLQHMLATGKEMTAKTQERLFSLTNGGGRDPSGFDAKSYGESLYFDLSALAWRDDEYIGLFENLAFQDKDLTYSLAIRSENKELFIPQGINIPKNDETLQKINSVFEKEYGESVSVQSFDCIALSGSGEERVKGIMAISDDCRQMGILMHMARIGKKLIIRFYTLFMPTASDLATQKQQALSIYKNLSLSVSMWESSLKDTMLMAMEQLLNSNVQGDGFTNTDPVGRGGNEPIF